MRSGKLFSDIGLPPINPQDDRDDLRQPEHARRDQRSADSFGLKDLAADARAG
jgi:ferredoxin--NADP+ reductase